MSAGSWLALYGRVGALLLPVIACAAIGAWWGLKKRTYPGEFIGVLVTTVATPSLIFHTLLTTRLDAAQLLQVGSAALLGLAIVALLSAVALRAARLPVLALLPTATVPNGGNLGLPIAQLAFGDTGLAVAVIFFACCTLLQHTLGVWVLTRGSGSVSASWPRGVALACVAAVALRAGEVALPEPILASARLVGSLTVPLMLLSLGYALVTVSHAGIRRGSLVGAIRLASGAVAGWIVGRLLGLPPLVAGVVALQLVMPVAIVNYLYAERFTKHGDIAAGAVLTSTGIFIVLSPLLLAWLAGVR